MGPEPRSSLSNSQTQKWGDHFHHKPNLYAILSRPQAKKTSSRDAKAAETQNIRVPPSHLGQVVGSSCDLRIGDLISSLVEIQASFEEESLTLCSKRVQSRQLYD